MKAVIYARVSSVEDRQSTDRQVHDLKSYAIDKGYKVERRRTYKWSKEK